MQIMMQTIQTIAFLKAKGYEVGTSLLEEDQIETVKGYMERAEKNGRRTRAADRCRHQPGLPEIR